MGNKGHELIEILAVRVRHVRQNDLKKADLQDLGARFTAAVPGETIVDGDSLRLKIQARANPMVLSFVDGKNYTIPRMVLLPKYSITIISMSQGEKSHQKLSVLATKCSVFRNTCPRFFRNQRVEKGVEQ